MALIKEVNEQEEEKLAVKELAILVKLERYMKQDLNIYFDKLYKEFAKVYAETGRKLSLEKFRKDLEYILATYYKATWKNFKGSIADKADLDDNRKKLVDKKMLALLLLFLQSEVQKRAGLILNGTNDILNNKIQDAVNAGLSREQSEDYLYKKLDEEKDARSKTIAQTEVGIAHGTVKQNEAEAVSAVAGMTMRKVWNAVMDMKTRPYHSEAHIKYHTTPIPIYEPFIVGGEALMYPKDPAGSAGNIINCRCTSFYIGG